MTATAQPTTSLRISGRKLFVWLLAMNAVQYGTHAAFMVIFVPDQVQMLDPANKVANLAIVMSAASVGAIIIHPIVGAFSDRTRSRFGKRAPWMVISAATAAVLMILLSGASNLLWLAVYYVLVMLAMHTLGTAYAAVMPDRVERKRFGAASGFMAMGSIIGMAGGVAAAAVILNTFGFGYAAFGAVVLVVTLLFTIFNRDFSSQDAVLPPFELKKFFASLWVNPRKHPDFWWAFAGRFLMILAYQSVHSYILYILRDYVGLSDSVSTIVSSGLTTTILVCAPVTAESSGDKLDMFGLRIIPLAVTLSLWLGALITFFVIRPIPSWVLGSSRSTPRLTFEALTPTLAIGFTQGLLVGFVAQFAANELEAMQRLEIVLAAAIIGVVIHLVAQVLHLLPFGIGRWLTLAIAVLVLATSIVSATPPVFMALADILPISSASALLLEPIVGGTSASPVWPLLAWGAAAAVIVTLAVARSRSVSPAYLRREARVALS